MEYDFVVRANDAVLGRYVDRALQAFAAEPAVAPQHGGPTRVYSLVVYPEPGQCAVWLDDDLLHATDQADGVVSYLLWHVNRQVVAASSDRYLLVHASAAEHQGVGLIFPAPMESGKTTLVAGLVQEGLRYVTDEAAAIDMSSLLLHPFPKALSVDAGSWEALSGLRPTLEPGAERFVRDQWHVDPAVAIRPGATVGGPCPVSFVIAPSYVRGTTTALVPLARSEAIAVLARNSFNFGEHGRAGLAAAAGVVRRSACYRLTVAELGAACRLVLGLLDPTHPGRRT